MMNLKCISLSLLFLLIISVSVKSQGVWTITDPNQHEVILDKDSSFLILHQGNLLFYAWNTTVGNMNILSTNGDTSFWLLNTGFLPEEDYTPFLYRKADELIFRTGDIWYTSYGNTETTQIFYNNLDTNSEYIYLKIFELNSISENGHDLSIEAIEKSTGDTVTLFHHTDEGTTEPYFQKLKIIEGNIGQVGPYSGEFLIGAIYNETAGDWSEVGVYRQSNSDFRLLLPLGTKENYKVNPLYYYAKDFYIDHLDNGNTIVYEYSQSIDSCVEVTNSEFPGYTVLDAINPKWPWWGPDFPFYGSKSFENIIWKGRNSNGNIRYFLRSLFEQEFEIVDLRSANNVDLVFSHFQDDSIYYYNYANQQRGLVRTNFQNGVSTKEATSIPFDESFKLQAYNGKLYFGRYNAQSGTIQAITKDFTNDGKYEYLESLGGKRIDNPIDFSFIGDRIFIHSRTDEGIKLIVFDPDAIVSVEPQPLMTSIAKVFPNPSQGLIQIQLSNFEINSSQYRYVVSDINGVVIASGKVIDAISEVDLSQYPNGSYHLSLKRDNTIVHTETIILSK